MFVTVLLFAFGHQRVRQKLARSLKKRYNSEYFTLDIYDKSVQTGVKLASCNKNNRYYKKICASTRFLANSSRI